MAAEASTAARSGEIADVIALPEGRKEKKLQRELAVTLYRKGMLSFGKARELADLDKFAFAQLLGKWGVGRHYELGEFDEDLAYTRSGESASNPLFCPIHLTLTGTLVPLR